MKSFKEFSTDAHLRVGTTELLPTQQAEKLGLFTIVWNQGNPITLEVDGQPVVLPEQGIIAFTPIQYVQFPTHADSVVYQFNREFYCIKDHDKQVSCVGLLFFGNNHTPIITLDAEEQQKFGLLHHIFLEELEHQDNVQAEMLRMLTARLVIKVTRLLKETGSTQQLFESKVELLRKYNQLVETHFRTQHSVAFYADLLHKSPKTLSNSFSKLDTSPIKIIHDRIILEAKRQLMYTDRSAKEIAYDVGFEDASHLSRMFKKVTGISPTQFRNDTRLTA